jgi:redox-sensing transcriptional repressor
MLKIKFDKSKIPAITINRLSIYYRCLNRLAETKAGKNLKTISSHKISEITGINSTQVRKDLAYFGEFGRRGIGYPVDHLAKALREILGLNKAWNIIIVGAGNLGKALASYKGFEKKGFVIKGIFDFDSKKIGKQINNVPIYDIEKMEEFISGYKIKIGVIAVPADSAQYIMEKMIAGGIQSILNFAPISLSQFPGIRINNVDLSIELERLSYYLSS